MSVVRRAQPWLGTLVSIEISDESDGALHARGFAAAFAAVARVLAHRHTGGVPDIETVQDCVEHTLAAAGCGPSIYETYEYAKEWDPRRHEYVIGVSDTVRINVYHTGELSGEGVVRPDGVIETIAGISFGVYW